MQGKWKQCWLALLACLSGLVWGRYPDADVNSDNFVDMQDLAIVASQWLQPGGPVGTAIEWAIIDPNTFSMGDALTEGNTNELPVHQVRLTRSFEMSIFEITNAQYAAFLNAQNTAGLIKVVSGAVYAVDDGAKARPWFSTSTAQSESQIQFKDNVFSVRIRDKQPQHLHSVVFVSWYGAVAYCDWRSVNEGFAPLYNKDDWSCDMSGRGYRLPTEAEWEYAARGRQAGKRWPWGDAPIDHARVNYTRQASTVYTYEGTNIFATGTFPYTAPVGSFAPNGFGLYDMAGNGLEWCNDWYGAYAATPQGNPQVDPTGPASGTYRVMRGGNWSYDASYCRVAYRSYTDPRYRYNRYSFRVIRDHVEP